MYAILYGPDDEPTSWLQAGQALSALWLYAVATQHRRAAAVRGGRGGVHPAGVAPHALRSRLRATGRTAGHRRPPPGGHAAHTAAAGQRNDHHPGMTPCGQLAAGRIIGYLAASARVVDVLAAAAHGRTQADGGVWTLVTGGTSALWATSQCRAPSAGLLWLVELTTDVGRPAKGRLPHTKRRAGDSTSPAPSQWAWRSPSPRAHAGLSDGPRDVVSRWCR